MKVNYIDTQYVHKFTNGDEVKYVTCSNDDFTKIIEKPYLEEYEYQYTVKDMFKVDNESGLLQEGEYFELDGKTCTANWEEDGEVKSTWQ